nr:hypothetical protein CFP56_75344 [Quercus suber]
MKRVHITFVFFNLNFYSQPWCWLAGNRHFSGWNFWGRKWLHCISIESALPSLARPIMSLDANEDVVVDALKQSLEFGQPKACIEAKKKQPSNSDIQSSLKQEVLTWFGLWTDQTLVFYEKQENLSKLWDILAV